MQLLFSDKNINVAQLYPFTLTRKVEDIRMGIFTIREKWLQITGAVAGKKATAAGPGTNNYIIAANLLPNEEMAALIGKLKPGQQILDPEGNMLVTRASSSLKKKTVAPAVANKVLRIEFPWHIFQYNAEALAFDFELAKKGRKRGTIAKTVCISGKGKVFIEKGADVRHAIINADDGPVFIEQGALVMEGSLLRGPLYIGAGAVVKMGTKLYGATTIGPGCTVGGEIKNSVLFAYSNKAHDGYMGDSVIGEWCNWGGGTTNSNLKNTAGNITVHLQGNKYNAGKKCGVMMGDYSRTAINTSINTGTVIGVSANVFGAGLTPKQIPSFSWGFDDTTPYRLEKALADINNWKGFKHASLTETEIETLTNIYKSKTRSK
ncbi:MAG: putative sugar nucleotidyl transferase [Niabella sp.]